MRKFGAELRVEAMPHYNYVPNKSALLGGIVEALLGELRRPYEDEGRGKRIKRAYRLRLEPRARGGGPQHRVRPRPHPPWPQGEALNPLVENGVCDAALTRPAAGR